jgi:hypothetical protein
MGEDKFDNQFHPILKNLTNENILTLATFPDLYQTAPSASNPALAGPAGDYCHATG